MNWAEEAKANYDLEALRDAYFVLEAERDRLRFFIWDNCDSIEASDLLGGWEPER